MVEEHFMGMPMSTFFKAEVRKAIVIGCSQYEELRQIEGKENFADIPETLDDIKVVKAGLKRLQFQSSEIEILKDPNYQKIKIAIDSASREIFENYEEGRKTLLYVYYAGHGMMDNTTYCVLNGKRMYPLEKMLRTIAKQDGSYVMSVFDCCREKL